MRAVVWHDREDVRVDRVPDPRLVEDNDAIVRITTTAICGSDLHLYGVLSPLMEPGDILGHEPMGIVEEVGAAVTDLVPGDRVVIPFTISCGRCFMCQRGLHSQCETTQVHEYGCGAALFGYTKLYGQVPGGQAEYLRVPHADFIPIKVPADGGDDERFVYLSDVLPTSWQAVEYAAIPPGGSVAVFGLGPIGQMSARIARHRGARVIGIERVPERIEMAQRNGIEVVPLEDDGHSVADRVRDLTEGRGTDSVIDAVGMEAHGSPISGFTQQMTRLLPDKLAEAMLRKAGVDRLAALMAAIDTVRRGGTLSIIGVYGGMLDPLPMLTLFDKQVQIRLGQANVKRWVEDVMPLLTDPADPLRVGDLATHRLPLDRAPEGYRVFREKRDGAIKVLLHP